MMSRLLVVAPLLCLVACGDGEASFNSGVPRETRASELTPAQARTVCERAEDAFDRHLGERRQQRIFCVARGLSTTPTSRSVCQAVYDECMREDFDEPLDLDLACDEATAPPAEVCDATLGEIEDCTTAQIRLIDDVVGQFDCNLADDLERAEELFESFTGLEEVPACEALAESCPNFLGNFIDDED